MKSPKILIALAVLGTAFSLRSMTSSRWSNARQCSGDDSRECMTAKSTGKSITIDDHALVAEIDLPGRRDDLKVLVGSDGKLIKTRGEIDLADAPTAVREAAAKLVPAGGELDDGVSCEVTDGKATYSVEIDRPKIPDLDVLIAEDGTLMNQTDDTGGLTCQ
jgi:hypothetical protein